MRVCVVLALLSQAAAYKVLLYSPPTGYSHLRFMAAIADTLHNAGHQVHVFHPSIDPRDARFVAHSAHPWIYKMRPEFVQSIVHENRFYEIKTTIVRLRMIQDFFKQQYEICEEIVKNNTLFDVMRAEKYDVGISEIFGICGFGIFEMAGIPNALLASSIGLVDNLGGYMHTPVMPSYLPFVITSFSDRMTFPQRAINFIWSIISNITYQYSIINSYKHLFKKYGGDFEFDTYVREKINYALVNTDEYVDFGRPESQKVVHIGGIHMPHETPPLDEDLLSIVERNSSLGTVLFSFGTNANAEGMPDNIKNAFVSAARRMPEYEFIWKFSLSALSNHTLPSNLHVRPWIPQVSLLEHPRVVSFVTHGGMNSVIETAIKATPAVVIPLFGDQFKNSKILESKGTGVVVNSVDVSPDSLVRALRTTLGYDFASRAFRISEMVARRGISVQQRLIEAVENTARFGKMREIDVAGWELSSIQYFSLDVISFLLLCSFSLYKAISLARSTLLPDKTKIE